MFTYHQDIRQERQATGMHVGVAPTIIICISSYYHARQSTVMRRLLLSVRAGLLEILHCRSGGFGGGWDKSFHRSLDFCAMYFVQLMRLRVYKLTPWLRLR